MLKVNSSSAGFSLIEIMIVVVIIGMLAGLVGMTAPGIIVRNRQKAARVQIKNLNNAVHAYFIENGNYPDNLEALVMQKGTDDGYIESLPKDPWGQPYIYQKPGVDGSAYTIESFGADKMDGGEGRNKDIESWTMDEPEQ